MTGRMLIAASLAVAAGGCCWPALAAAATPVAAADAAGRGCIDTVVPGTDYFPDKVALDYAENFSVAYHDTYRVVTVHVPAPGQPPDQYVLVRCGAPVPELGPDLAGAVVIETPVWTVYSSAASANAALAILDALDLKPDGGQRAFDGGEVGLGVEMRLQPGQGELHLRPPRAASRAPAR